MNERVIFARIGWMTFYRGSQPGDERPIGGGAWNDSEIGHEVHNFKVDNQAVHGFVNSRSNPRHSLNLLRIDLEATGTQLSGVDVIWVATHPKEGKQRIIGWYKDAVAFDRYRRLDPTPRGNKHGFYLFQAPADKACLLPPDLRQFVVPGRRGGFGQANVCYPLDQYGNEKGFDWMAKAVQYVSDYQGPNLLTQPHAVHDQIIEDAFESAKAGSFGQAFGGTAMDRKAVEKHSMKRAVRYFRRLGYTCDPTVHKNKPYDILCRKGSKTLYVEVKGTRGGDDSVLLTRGEVRHVRTCDKQCALYTLYGVKLAGTKANPIAKGGSERVIHNWKIEEQALHPLSYEYRLP